mgnify:CR=1 FL=1
MAVFFTLRFTCFYKKPSLPLGTEVAKKIDPILQPPDTEKLTEVPKYSIIS